MSSTYLRGLVACCKRAPEQEARGGACEHRQDKRYVHWAGACHSCMSFAIVMLWPLALVMVAALATPAPVAVVIVGDVLPTMHSHAFDALWQVR